jgi:cytosine/adenosine deaminase-related metal-dependent hydrolase
LTENDINILAGSGASIVHNPSANLRLRSGIAPIHELIANGVDVAIGSDNGSMNDDEDFFQDMRLALRIHRVPGLQNPVVSSKEILGMVLNSGARVCGFENQIGTLEPGKSADLILINLEKVFGPYMELNMGVDVIDALVYRGKALEVDTVIINGEVVMRDRKFTKIEKDTVFTKVIESASRPKSPEQVQLAQLVADLRPFAEDVWKSLDTMADQAYYAYNSKS